MPRPSELLERRIERFQRRTDKLRLRNERFSRIRLGIALAGGLAAAAVFDLLGPTPGALTALGAFAAFVAVALVHGRLRRAIGRHEIWIGIQAAQLARLRLDWDRIPPPLRIAADPGHPFDLDLDITGERSVHRLMDTAVSREGSKRFHDWLLAGVPDPGTIAARQALVAELASSRPFRDKLILHAVCAFGGHTARALEAKWDVRQLVGWIEHNTPMQGLDRTLFFLLLLAGADVAIFSLSAMGILPVIFRVVFFIYFGIVMLKQFEVARAFREALALESTLRALGAVFRHLEDYHYGEAPGLAGLCAPFLDPGNRPSSQLNRLSRIISAVSVRSNPVVWLLLNSVMPWDMFFVHRLQRCKKDVASLLPRWLDTVFEIEALGSLANFAALHPQTVFPKLSTPPGGDPGKEAFPFIEARALGHPLIPDSERVCNDISMGESNRIVLITGSNMAGKSSFLRTLGVNLCLAQAGGTVFAQSFRASPFRLFACMRVNDSVTDGFSYFYAEVKRMKTMLDSVETSHPVPVFFMLDEIFKGTNNRERLMGSRAFVRTLAAQPCMGAIATHDLELVKLADENTAITNYHFREEIRGERMVFDYRLRPGPCPTTNALKIMAMVGLPVQHEVE